MKKTIILVFIGILGLVSCVTESKAGKPKKKTPSVPTITSSITGVTYPYHVYLPPSYKDNPEALFPVIYTTDGQWYFGGYLSSIASRGKEFILVAIEEGPRGSDRRATDYVLPGAKKYYQFLTTEFMPLVESAYRIDKSDRTIVGTSLGGLLVGYILFWDDPDAPLFRRYFAFDGSFWIAPKAMREYMDTRYAKSPNLKATLVLTSALIKGNDPAVTQFNAAIEKCGFQGLTILRHAFNCEHPQVGGPSFDYALDEVFGK
jgi:predicted alpha/beta superfamily hydrolase